MRVSGQCLLLTVALGMACAREGAGKATVPQGSASVSAKARLYVNGVLPDPISPAIGSAFSVTVSIANEGDASSGEYDLLVDLQRKGDSSVTFGSERHRVQSQEPGATARVSTGKSYFFKEAGDYEFIIITSLADGTTTEKHWQVQAR